MPSVVATLHALVFEVVAAHGGWVQGGFASTSRMEAADVQGSPLRATQDHRLGAHTTHH